MIIFCGYLQPGRLLPEEFEKINCLIIVNGITCENLVLTITVSPKRSVACWKSYNDVKMAIRILGGFSSSQGLPSFQEPHNDILIRMGMDLARGKWKIHI